MKIRKAFAGIATAAALVGGGSVAADSAVNPYTDEGAEFTITQDASLPGAGVLEVGLDKTEPAITLSKWEGAAEFTVIPEGEYGRGSRAFLTERMEWKGEDQEVHAYPLEAKAGMEDGGFEIEIFLKEKPDTNRFDFAIEGAEELDFFYQPALTPEEIELGNVRAENVIGSYAVYHKEKEGQIEGSINYGTGKAYHIFRPKAIDAKGNEIWAQLSYENGSLSVEVPQAFLDTAAYPVRVDPTIGYTSQGASDEVICSGVADYQKAHKASGLAGGTLTKISNYLKGTDKFTSKVWNSNGGGTLPVNTSPPHTGALTNIGSGSYTLQETSLTYVFVGAVQWVGVQGWEQTGSGPSYIAYDTGGVAGETSWDNDIGVWQTGDTKRYSVYGTYTAASVSSSITSDTVFFD